MTLAPANDNDLFDRITECLAIGVYMQMDMAGVFHTFRGLPNYTKDHEIKYAMFQKILKDKLMLFVVE